MSFIKKLQKKYPVSRLCKVLRFARSTYYEASVRVPSKRQRENAEFAAAVRDCFYESKQRYGAVKLQRVLEENGYPCSVKRVQRYMAAQNLRSVTCRKYRPQSSNTEIPERENVLNQEFLPDTICQKWCGDITYIHTQEDGWTYLASVMDLYSRKIIGWAYGKHMSASLVTKALEHACLNVEETKGILFHSDLGSQYTSEAFESRLKDKEMVHSYSRKGYPYDNACIESFHATLKKEEVYLRKYRTFEEANRALFEYIESWYNRKRIHGSIGFLTPQQKEDQARGII